jgi:hypothetical protein
MKLYSDNALSRYPTHLLMTALLACCSGAAAASVDDAWNAAPATRDTTWAQANSGPVNPKTNGQDTGGMFDGKWIRGSASGTNSYGAGILVSALSATANNRSLSVVVDGVQLCSSSFSSSMNNTNSETCVVPVPSNSTWGVTGSVSVNLFVPK